MRILKFWVIILCFLGFNLSSKATERPEDLPRGVVGALSCLVALNIDDTLQLPEYRDRRGTGRPIDFKGLTRKQVDDFYARIIIPWQETRGAKRALDEAGEFHGNLLRQRGYNAFLQQIQSCVSVAAEACSIRPSQCGSTPSGR